jgi:thiol-disulfide isomerase/thioredoxin
VVVLDFWGHYCSICIEHMPDLAKLAEQYPSDKLAVLTLHDASLASMAEVEEHLSDAKRKKLGTLPIALDGDLAKGVFGAYGIGAVPALVLIDAEGKVVRRFHHAGDPELGKTVGELLRHQK